MSTTQMNLLADRILYSKSGFTRVVDRMEDEGLVRRVRPENDRRTILVVLTDKGTETMEQARRHHRDGIERHFSRHLIDADIKALSRALEKISATHVHSAPAASAANRPAPDIRTARAGGRGSRGERPPVRSSPRGGFGLAAGVYPLFVDTARVEVE